ncbi:MAG: hypothetical protein KGY99_03400 [Phycisphaerae bacterium]|nr:hypothetical protein [Phycisphaerae bacterium]
MKYWSRAGILLSYWCSARCASCYLCCGPERRGWIDADLALRAWRGLVDASPHGCRVHLTGGEPFGNWDLLITIARRAHAEGLGPLEKVETNAFWADDDAIIRRRLAALDVAGMQTLSVSADPYHQQFVPIVRVRRLVRAAEEVLGSGRVQVRWRDWLAEGIDTAGLSLERRRRLFAEYAQRRRDRLTGRAAGMLGRHLLAKSVFDLADENCRQPLLRGRHVHVDPAGRISPGTCAGIVVGRVGPQTPGEIWRRLDADHGRRAIVATLVRKGPVGLVDEARRAGFRPAAQYAGKCHLCWEVRRFMANRGRGGQTLAPRAMYAAVDEAAGAMVWAEDES